MNARKNLDKPLKPAKAAARLSIAYEDLPHLDRPWTRRDVTRLRDERPDWLTRARRDYGAAQNEKSALAKVQRERQLASAPRGDCLCCGTEFALTRNSGGLCEDCNEGVCAGCGDEDDWYG